MHLLAVPRHEAILAKIQIDVGNFIKKERVDMKLHLGCGPKYIEGWIHCDALEYKHVDIVGPVDSLPFDDCMAEIVYASHVLEHFGRHECTSVLAEWYRVLKPSGVLRLAVPNFMAACEVYLDPDVGNSIELIKGLVCGGQKDKFDYHGNIFDFKSLGNMLKSVGFQSIKTWDWRQTEHSHIDDYSQAYLPHMDKMSGKLVSLNMEAIK